MIYRATLLIKETFESHGLKFQVRETENASIAEAGFEVESGPEVIVRFISINENNDVAVRVFGLMHKIPDSKKAAVLEACNALNTKIRFVKFVLGNDSNINLEADLPMKTDDSCIGECCFELFARIIQILNTEYHVLAEAVYQKEEPEKRDSNDFLKILRELRDKPFIIRNEEMEQSGGEDASNTESK